MNPIQLKGASVESSFDDSNVKINDDEVIINHFGAVSKILQQFGHEITRLRFNCTTFDGLAPPSSEIGRQINEYCSDSLIQFDVVNNDKSFFNKMSKPFRKVESVSIAGGFNVFDSETLAFEELFPAMRKLALNKLEISDGMVAARRFPNLEEFFAIMTGYEGDFRQNHAEALIILNQQIRRLSFDYGSRSFLKFISKHLPHLDTLSIDNYYDFTLLDLSPIVFKNVKNLTIIACNKRSVPDNIHFPNLIEFSAYIDSWSGDKWIGIVHFMAKNIKTFRKLKIWNNNYANDFLQDDQLEKLSEYTLDLDEVHLKLDKNVNDDTIAKFVATNAKIKQIFLSRADPPNSFRNFIELIREKSKDKWNIIEFDGDILLEPHF